MYHTVIMPFLGMIAAIAAYAWAAHIWPLPSDLPGTSFSDAMLMSEEARTGVVGRISFGFLGFALVILVHIAADLLKKGSASRST